MNDVAALGGLFLSAFLAATLLPAQSESVLAVLTISGTWPLWLLVAVASAGNVLGAVVNWLLGRAVTSLRDRRWFPVSERALARAQAWYGRYGRWSLLVAIGKTARYVVIALAASGFA